jgi:hypothetical protein
VRRGRLNLRGDPGKRPPMTLNDERLEALRTGDVVRIPVPELGGDVLMVLAMPDESTEQVLEETL